MLTAILSAVAEEPPDDRQALAEREHPGGEVVAHVADAQVIESGARTDRMLGFVDVSHVRAGLCSRNDPEIVRFVLQGRKQVHRRRPKMGRAVAGLPVNDARLDPDEIGVLPA